MKPAAVSAVVLSATLLASGSAAGPAGSVSASAAPAAPPGTVPVSAPVYEPKHAAYDAVADDVFGLAVLSVAPVEVAAAPLPPRPVAGLDQTQMNNAAAIVKQGRAQGIPEKGLIVAVATAMQESDLYIAASPAVPSSLKLPHDNVSVDHDSVGLFQQRASQGWGSVPELMDPARSAMLFYNALDEVSGWQSMSVTGAAQAVQRSAYPGAYQKHADRAAEVVAALT
ncbi:peptidase M23 [Dactylosporangium vinaceum]|uniref:Peptidase M23 n=1 Tax=Dactylosporangium vinaceum TaxID=53362 RepID=A0ABV5M7D8_9ACTN|nr:peptidase M23 [Dactylosporangium vinaceum]UAB95352.1 peptidase M23 [Dactylosporangium vinaceum]